MVVATSCQKIRNEYLFDGYDNRSNIPKSGDLRDNVADRFGIIYVLYTKNSSVVF